MSITLTELLMMAGSTLIYLAIPIAILVLLISLLRRVKVLEQEVDRLKSR